MHLIKVVPSRADLEKKKFFSMLSDLFFVVNVIDWTSEEAWDLRERVRINTGTFRPRTNSNLIVVVRSNLSVVMSFVDPTTNDLEKVRAHMLGQTQ